MVKDLVTELIRVHHLSPNDAKSLLLSMHATLLSLQQQEAPAATTSPETHKEVTQSDWKRSISKHSITCLECGDTFRQLSARHLRVHDLDPRSYRTKYGIPRTQALSSRDATARRREVAQQIRPWAAAASKRTTASQLKAKTDRR